MAWFPSGCPWHGHPEPGQDGAGPSLLRTPAPTPAWGKGNTAGWRCASPARGNCGAGRGSKGERPDGAVRVHPGPDKQAEGLRAARAQRGNSSAAGETSPAGPGRSSRGSKPSPATLRKPPATSLEGQDTSLRQSGLSGAATIRQSSAICVEGTLSPWANPRPAQAEIIAPIQTGARPCLSPAHMHATPPAESPAGDGSPPGPGTRAQRPAASARAWGRVVCRDSPLSCHSQSRHQPGAHIAPAPWMELAVPAPGPGHGRLPLSSQHGQGSLRARTGHQARRMGSSSLVRGWRSPCQQKWVGGCPGPSPYSKQELSSNASPDFTSPTPPALGGAGW